jgi:hypothetical protein
MGERTGSRAGLRLEGLFLAFLVFAIVIFVAMVGSFAPAPYFGCEPAALLSMRIALSEGCRSNSSPPVPR